MLKNLITFHFNPEKSGNILKRFAKDVGLSYQRLGDSIGYSYDTINNSLGGKVKELSLERVFKICTITGHSVCEYLREMLKDEDIDFADQIHVLREADFVLVPYDQASEKPPIPVQTPVQPASIEQNPMYQAAYQAMVQQAAATHQANLDRFRGIHEGYVKMLEDSHKKALEDQEKAHQEHIATVRKVARQRLRWIILLAVLLLAFIFWFVWDLSHPELGLIRMKQMGYIIGQFL